VWSASKYSMEDLDWGSETTVRDWLFERFEEKDHMLADFYGGKGEVTAPSHDSGMTGSDASLRNASSFMHQVPFPTCQMRLKPWVDIS
jgi:hypothetical protein